MKKQNSIREILGFTQEELAMLLGVTRSMLAKYELGLGDLPDTAKLHLAELLNHMKDLEVQDKPEPNEIEQPKVTEEQLDRLLLENSYQLNLVTKKIKTIQKKQLNRFKARKLLVYLQNRPQEKSEEHQNVLNLINNKNNKTLNSTSFSVLFTLQLKQQMLELEKRLLDAEKKKWSKTPENKGDSV